jgi:hypothetical protein
LKVNDKISVASYIGCWYNKKTAVAGGQGVGKNKEEKQNKDKEA